MDHEDDNNERDGVLVFDEVSPGEIEEEAKAMKEHLKLTKKRKHHKREDGSYGKQWIV